MSGERSKRVAFLIRPSYTQVRSDVTTGLIKWLGHFKRKLIICIVLFWVCIATSHAAQDYDSNAVTPTQGFTIFSGGDCVSNAGDINGDGFDDVAVGNSVISAFSGRVFVIFGNHTSFNSNVQLVNFATGPQLGFRILPASVGGNLGKSISKAGDVNGDGHDDIIIGAPSATVRSQANTGISYVIFGRKVTSPANEFTDIQLPNAVMDAAVGFRILGALAGDKSGWSVSGAGDINNDGIDDVLVGAPYADAPGIPGSDVGMAYVVFGKNLTGSALAFGDVDLGGIGASSTIGFRIIGYEYGDSMGYAVSRAGDLNGDGVSDIIVNANLATSPVLGSGSASGVSYVIFGHTEPLTTEWNEYIMSNAALNASIGFRIYGESRNDRSGMVLSYAGDVNGDGMDDVIIGAPEASPSTFAGNSGVGITYVIFGRNVFGGAPAFPDINLAWIVTGSTLGFRILGGSEYAYAGSAVSTAGDLNGDGIDDVIVGARYAVKTTPLVNSGVSYVIYGRKFFVGVNAFQDIDLATFGPASPVGFRVFGSVNNEESGYTVSSAGDVNNDGLSDIIVGSVAGPSLVIYGTFPDPTSQPSSQPSRQPSMQPSRQPSRQPSSQPSGQPSRQPTSQPTSAPSTQELSLSHLDNTRGFKMSLGSAVSSAGDLNGDGIDDMIVGASWVNGNTGVADVVFGSKNTVFQDIDFATRVTGPTTGFRILAAAAGDFCGHSVSKAGDVNGDGIDDVILGAYAADPTPGILGAGISYVIFGRKVTSPANEFTDIQLPNAAMTATVGFRILGTVAADYSGVSVSGAGDVNGDGINDVVVGAYSADPPKLPAESNSGIVYVVFGKNMTGSTSAFGDVELSSIVTGSTLGFRVLAAGFGDQLGVFVSRAGDVNHDGISDIIVGARYADPENIAVNSNAGVCYVILGRKVTSPANAFQDIQLTNSSLPSQVGFRILGAAVNDLSGASVRNAGDVNGDGIDDILVGVANADPPTLVANSNAGITYVIYGRNIANSALAFGDILLSSIVTGSTIGFRIFGAAPADSSGYRVAGAGDVNGDGVGDIVIGALNADPQPNKVDAGISYVFYGRQSYDGANPFSDIDLATLNLGSSVGFRILGAAAQDKSGNSVNGAGDFNGDGFDDVMIGTFGGPSYVIYGAPVSPTSQPSSRPSSQPSRQPSRQPTSQPSSQPSRQPSSQPSRQPSRQPTSQPSVQPSSQPTSQPTSAPSTQELSLSHLDNTYGFKMSLGSAVSSAGDLNGDGIDDIIVGASWFSTNTGTAYVVFGSRSTVYENIDFSTRVTSQTTGFRILAAAGYDFCGQSVSKAGDVNGDGVGDIIIGAYGADPSAGKVNAGISYVIFGRKVTSPANAFTNIQLTNTAMAAGMGFRILGAYSVDYSGISVSGAGDVNGDGIDDVIVGAYSADPPNLAVDSNAGIAYVVFGKNMTSSTAAFGDVDLSLIVTGSTLGFRILAAGFSHQLGVWVSRAGDVNHDGISDVVVGARYADPDTLIANSDAGVSYVIFGRQVNAPANAFGDIQLTNAALPSDLGFRILGAAVNDLSGTAIDSAGDVNGDGIDDIIVGVFYADPPTLVAHSSAGVTYIIYGRNVASGAPAFTDISLSSVSTGSTLGFRVLGAKFGDNSGYRVAGAGDVNGDGVDDIIIGAINADPQSSKTDAGISYLVYGRRSHAGANPFSDIDLASLYLGSSVGFRILGAAAQDKSGTSVSGAGDINGDGFDDVMVGTLVGPSYVIYGAPASPTSQPSSQPSRQPSRQPSSEPSVQPSRQPSSQPSTQPTKQPSAQPSRQPSSQPSRQPSRQPTVQPTTQPTSAPSTQELSLSHLDNTRGFTMTAGGNSVSSAGDINGDGIDDIIMGAYWTNSYDGRVYVLFGKKNVLMSDVDLPTFTTSINTGFRILPAGSGSRLGWSVGAAGDVNGDGVDDVIMSARFATSSAGRINAGITYVIYGLRVTSAANAFTDIQLPTTAMAASVGFRILGAATADSSGYSVSGAGDINGDGIDDVVTGAFLADPPSLSADSNAGIAYVIFGKNLTGSTLSFGDIDLLTMGTGSTFGFRILGAVAVDQLGFSVSRAGDVNGDGISDIVLGANQADPPGVLGGGICYVIFGRKVASPAIAFGDIQLTNTSLASSVGFRILGAHLSGSLGVFVSHAGDVNGDGLDDVIVGAPSARISYVIFGRNVPGGATPFSDIQLTTTSMPPSVGFRILGAANSDNSGVAVAGVGDVNDDGVDDVLIGARYGDPSLEKDMAGISYVVYGRKSVNGAPVFGDVNLASIGHGSLIGFRILGAATNDVSGYTVSGAGDFNGDGVPDLMIGTQLRNSYVIYGIPASPTSQPSGQPSLQPSVSPTSPTSQPTSQPSTQPSRQPSLQPSLQPVSSPSSQPSSQPSMQPTCQPSAQPSLQPSLQPLSWPSSQPSRQPTTQPSNQPTKTPSGQPSQQPSGWPSSQPSSQPSARPSDQPSDQPSVSPTTQPSPQPSTQPSAQPSAYPSSQPVCLPSAQPSGLPSLQPTTQPSAQPSALPSAQPSTQPTVSPSLQKSDQPSVQPSGQPSKQPSVRPSRQPTSQLTGPPSAQPTTQPSSKPSEQPSSQPTMLPSSQPTVKPSRQPSAQPSAQPSQQPQSVPSGQPTTSPTSFPTIDIDTWVTAVDTLNSISELTTINSNVWVCGQNSVGASCAVIEVPISGLLFDYQLPWTDIFSTTQAEDTSRVVISGHIVNPLGVMTSEVANCAVGLSHLTCMAKLFYDTAFTAATYVPFPRKFMYTGVYSTFATVSVEDAVTLATKSFIYTSSAMRSVTISHAAAPPSFVGAFVTGTCVSTNGASNYIVSGMVRTDSGAMSAVYLAPTSGSILNTVDLVTAMALEYSYPDSLIAGGSQISTTSGKHAYLLRVNALIGSIKYSKRYRATRAPTSETEVRRRTLSETVTYSSVTRGMVLIDTALFMVADVTPIDEATPSHMAILKISLETGLILQQVHVSSPNASLTCRDITTSTEQYLHLACSIVRPATTKSIIITTTLSLMFNNFPPDLQRLTDVVMTEENVPFQRFALPITVRATQSIISDYPLSSVNAEPTFPPTYVPTLKPSIASTEQPSSQPSSSPTAAPSVSPQPTSHPSSSGPTNTYKPTAKPTQQPSATPSTKPTQRPSRLPTTVPSAQPTLKPSTRPSQQPSVIRTNTPTRSPLVRASLKPSAAPTTGATRVPSAANTIQYASEGKTKDSDLAIVIGGYTLGGVIALWLFSRLFRWYLREVHSRAKKREIYLQLYATRVLQAEQYTASQNPTERNPDRPKRQPQTDNDNDNARVASAGAYMDGPLRSPHQTKYPKIDEDSVDTEVVSRHNVHAPPAGSVHSSSSSGSSIVLSSLHSSERSDMNEQYFSTEQNKHIAAIKPSKSKGNMMEEGLTSVNTPNRDINELNYHESDIDSESNSMGSVFSEDVIITGKAL